MFLKTEQTAADMLYSYVLYALIYMPYRLQLYKETETNLEKKNKELLA